MMHPRKGEFFSSRVCYISLNQIHDINLASLCRSTRRP